MVIHRQYGRYHFLLSAVAVEEIVETAEVYARKADLIDGRNLAIQVQNWLRLLHE
ncbi:hypothetical protein D3C86_2244760 [compost metagenome]